MLLPLYCDSAVLCMAQIGANQQKTSLLNVPSRWRDSKKFFSLGHGEFNQLGVSTAIEEFSVVSSCICFGFE